MKKAVIVSGKRTPFGKYKGSLKKIRPDDLASIVLKNLIDELELNKLEIDEVVLGCANQAGEDNRNIARMSLLLSGISPTVPAVTLNRLCGSGQEAIHYGTFLIETGRAKLVLAGGVESMTRAPWVMLKPENDFDRGEHKLIDSTIGWRFENPKLNKLYPIYSLGESAEIISEEFSISKSEQDLFSFNSHKKAIEAKSKFKKEIISIFENEKLILDFDEHIREDISLENLEKLTPLFKKNGTVTAGNSSGINDGSAILVLMEKEFALANGYKPIAEIFATSVVGIDPKFLGVGPVYAIEKILKQTNLNLKDISLFEISEAFAAMTLGTVKKLDLDIEKVNINGGGISIGHPLGASGTRMILNLANELKLNSLEYGISSMCIGVGQGIATIIKSI